MSGEDEVAAIAKNRNILDVRKQRILWARVSAMKQLLIRKGIFTHAEFESMVSSMVKDIDQKVLEGVRKDLGLDESED